MPHSEFAKSNEEAQQRSDATYSIDPFSTVEKALLSAADIEAYAKETGMLHPFHMTSLKSASYEIHIGGRFIYWQRDGKLTRKVDRVIDRTIDKSITLPANSISYVQAEANFRLPRYIAIRFNLRITHVHRGLLLGTGPLVDPGFAGKLLIPLHNLTSDSYEINLNDALIWVEFTKTTYLDKRAGEIDFPKDKKWKEPEYYFQKANKNEPILSSIPDAIEETRLLSKNATADAASAKTWAKSLATFGYIAIVAILIGVFSLIWNVYASQQGLQRDLNAANTRIDDLSSNLKSITTSNETLQLELNDLRSNMSAPTKPPAPSKPLAPSQAPQNPSPRSP